jgi:vitamin B12 transporter
MRYLFSSALTLAALGVLSSAAAQADDEIIVTATRAPTELQRVPAAIVVIDTEAARERGAITLDQALSDVPGIQAPRTGPTGQQASIFSGGFESNHTLILFDGVRLDDPSTPEGIFDAGQDMFGDATRIEIVQGPMSALYGSAALGGVVNIIPQRGGEGSFNTRAELGAGSFQTLTGTAGIDGTLGPLRYAISAEVFETEGYDIVPERIAGFNGEKDGAESATLTGVFDFDMNDRLSLDLLLRRREARSDFDPGFFGNIGENPEAEIERNDTALSRLGATWRVTDALSFRLSGGALETDRIVADAGVVGDSFFGERQFADALVSWDAESWQVQAGATHEDESIDANSFGSAVRGTQDHWGVFSTAQASLGAFDLTAALRHDDYEGFGGETTWRAGAVYGVGANGRVYGSYGTSFRAPSLYERFVPFFGAAGLQPESAHSWEIGGEARWPAFNQEDGLSLDALYRASEIDDLIGFFGFSYANVDRAEIKFAQARISVRPAPWLTARAAYTNTDARDVGADRALQRRPRHAWSAEIEAKHGPISARLAWREVGSRLDVTYDDAGAFIGVDRVAAYDLLSLSATWSINESARVFVAADNALDETYEPVNGFAGAPSSLMAGVRWSPTR